jgi:hypothetical protein
MGLNGRSRWRFHDHSRLEKAGRDKPPFRLEVAKIIHLSGKAVTSAMGRDLPLDASPAASAKGQEADLRRLGAVFDGPRHAHKLAQHFWTRSTLNAGICHRTAADSVSLRRKPTGQRAIPEDRRAPAHSTYGARPEPLAAERADRRRAIEVQNQQLRVGHSPPFGRGRRDGTGGRVTMLFAGAVLGSVPAAWPRVRRVRPPAVRAA